MSEAAAAYDEDLDLSPEVLCALLRRRSMTTAAHDDGHEPERERTRKPHDVFHPTAPDRLNPIWV